MSHDSSSIKTVKSHTDKKYHKSKINYLHTRMCSNRKITLLMKGHPHEFGHTASWSDFLPSTICKNNDEEAMTALGFMLAGIIHKFIYIAAKHYST